MSVRLSVHDAATRLAKGELVAFPTETVYGLGANAENDAAVAKIFAAKGRPSDHPLIVHVSAVDQITHFVSEVPDFAQRLLAAFTPGPLTLILPRKSGVATASAGGQDSVGIRIPAHPIAQALLQAALRLGVRGVSAPSANKFGRVSPTTAQHVRDEFGEQVAILDGGACEVGIESTIVDCTRGSPVLLRPGVITQHQLEDAMGVALQSNSDLASSAPKASGTLASHYAPNAKVVIKDSLPTEAPSGIVLYQLPADALAAAHDLFATLRALDAKRPDQIWVSAPPTDVSWDGVRDRLNRAAA